VENKIKDINLSELMQVNEVRATRAPTKGQMTGSYSILTSHCQFDAISPPLARTCCP